MKILLIQSENDEGDLAEMRNGMINSCELTDKEKAQAVENIRVCTICDKSAEAFAETLDGLLVTNGPFDLVIIDPAFAYLGGDSNSQRDVGHFLRELLTPLLQRHKVGLLLIHHTNKPYSGKEKPRWQAGDYAYLGSGSAEWINPCRAALALRSLGSDTVFELRATKRGKRLRWKDADGMPSTTKYLAHHADEGVICWSEANPDDVSSLVKVSKGGRPKQYDDHECVHAVQSNPGQNQGFYLDLVADVLSCGKETVRKMLKVCVTFGWLKEAGDNRFKKYVITESGKDVVAKNPTKLVWSSHKP